MGCGGRLARMRPGILDSLVEGNRRISQRLESHCARHVAEAGEPLGSIESEAADGTHGLCSVKESKTFLSVQHDRGQSRGPHGICAGHSGSAVEGMPFAD